MPIDQTMRGLALEINAAADPTASETQPLLEYRFINSANTQTILARIKAIAPATGGGQLGFETNAGSETTIQRMLLDYQGNLGIGTEKPAARLDVAGDAKFSGPLSVQGDLSVAGKLTAASFSGDGSGLSNVGGAAGDDSITSAKLAEDAASLGKMSAGKIVVEEDTIGIWSRLEIEGAVRVHQGEHSAGVWFVQKTANRSGFVGMASNDEVGLFGVRDNNAGIGWGLRMRTDNGDVQIAGKLTAKVKQFKIDHPLDPANKYLSHSSVESPDVMNIYNGNVITDSEGNATVMLPDYFEALNGDFRYQLTVIGKLAQAAVASEIENNRFTIKTDHPNVKVSWQVTGIRHDASAKANRFPVEEEKPEAERGLYLHPEDYGQPSIRGVAFARSPVEISRAAYTSHPMQSLAA